MNFNARIREDYDESAHKLLHEQRDAYIVQSAMTRDGELAAFRYASEACADGDAGINYREGFAMKYGAACGAD